MRAPLLVLVALLGGSSPAFAAPFDILVSLDPGQTGPVYDWSLTIDVEDGYSFGAVQLLVTGLDTFAVNTANPAISPADSVFRINPLGDGRNVLILVNTANGVAIATGPATGVLLGTFTSAFADPSAIGVFNCDFECGGTVLDPDLAVPLADYSIDVVGAPIPEPRYLGFISLVVAGATIAQVSRSRSRGVTRRA